MAAPQGLLVQQQLHPSGGGGSLESANGRPPAKLSSIQSAETVSMQTYSDPSEDAAAALASSASMQSRPGSKVVRSPSLLPLPPNSGITPCMQPGTWHVPMSCTDVRCAHVPDSSLWLTHASASLASVGAHRNLETPAA